MTEADLLLAVADYLARFGWQPGQYFRYGFASSVEHAIFGISPNGILADNALYGFLRYAYQGFPGGRHYNYYDGTENLRIWEYCQNNRREVVDAFRSAANEIIMRQL